MTAAGLFFTICAALYLGLAGLILLQARRSPTGWALAVCCLLTAVWAGAHFGWPSGSTPTATGPFDLVRAAGWYGFLLLLYWRSTPGGRLFALFAIAGIAAVLVAAPWAGDGILTNAEPFPRGALPSLLSPLIAGRLGLAICQVLLAENLYQNTAPSMRWHVVLPCVALGALAAFDIFLCSDAVLFHGISVSLSDARAGVTAVVAPLLMLAAARDRRWAVDVHLSRQAVFHSATLVLCGMLLLVLAMAGTMLQALGADWGQLLDTTLLFMGVVLVALLLTSATARSRVHTLVVDHFFTLRYDYRREWMRCVRTLTGSEPGEPLHARVIRAVAEVVDSPGGSLFLREGDGGAFRWQGSWNMPAVTLPVPPEHKALDGLGTVQGVVVLGKLAPPLDVLSRAWLAVPLVQGGLEEASLRGFVVLAQPRAAFRLDAEVFALLRTIGREVATFVAEQRAAQVMVQTRQLHDYGKRFAFVAHDIKNLSSQLTMLLANAERHLANPEFQQDMLVTIRASVDKISNLLFRLQSPDTDAAQAFEPLPRLEALSATYQRLRDARVRVEHDGSTGTVPMAAEAFDTAVTHLLNNAVEAGGAVPVSVRVRHEAGQVIVEIADRGRGMTAEFVRDSLFQPFRTSKPEGSGIGAFQARELLREAGGDLLVESRPGFGTTMRLVLPRSDATARSLEPV